MIILELKIPFLKFNVIYQLDKQWEPVHLDHNIQIGHISSNAIKVTETSLESGVFFIRYHRCVCINEATMNDINIPRYMKNLATLVVSWNITLGVIYLNRSGY